MKLAIFIIAIPLAAQHTVAYDQGTEVRVVNIGGTTLGATITGTAGSGWSVSAGTCTGFRYEPSSGSAGAFSVRAMPDDITTTSITAGQNDTTGSCNGTIDGVAFTINYRVRRANGVFATDFGGRADTAWASGACSADNSLHAYKNKCTASTAYAPQDGVAAPSVGATVTDDAFKGVGLYCGGTSAQPYGTYSFNRDATYYVSPNGVKSTSDCSTLAALPGSGVCSGYSTIYWNNYPGATALSGWCFYASTPFTIKAWHISGGAFVDDGVIFTHAYNLADHGSTGTPINPDGWFVFPDSNNQFCITNLRLGATANLHCIQLKYYPTDVVRSVQLSPRPDRNGIIKCHYVNDGLNPSLGPSATIVHSFNPVTGTLTRDEQMVAPDRGWVFGNDWGGGDGYNACVNGTTCLRSGHQNIAFVGNKSYEMGNPLQYQANSYIYGFQSCSTDNGADGCNPEEVGGGARTRVWSHVSEYVVCAVNAPVCGGAGYGDETRVRLVTATESAGTCTGTVSGTNPWVTSDRVLFDGFSATGWNGYKTLASSSGSTITWSCTGTGTAVAGYGVIATVFNDGNSVRWNTTACRADNGHCRMLSKIQGTSAADGNPYDDDPLPQISPDGSLLKVNNSFGYPDRDGIIFLQTGFENCTFSMKPNQFCGGGGVTVVPLSTTTAQAIVTTPYAPGSCTIGWGVPNDFTSQTTQVLSGGLSVRYYSITSLTAGVTYTLTLKCDGLHRGVAKPDWNFAKFVWTQPTSVPGGTTRWPISSAGATPASTNELYVEFGTSASYGSTATLSGCTAGARCTGSLASVTRNSPLYWRVTPRNSGTPTGPAVSYFQVVN